MRWCLVPLLAPVVADFQAPKYTVDLDKPPVERWGPLLANQVDKHGWDYSYGPIIDFVNGILPFEDWKKYDKPLQAVGLAMFGVEYFEEVTGVYLKAKQLGFGDQVTNSMLVFFQLFYELAMQCTGIIAHDPDGRVMHGRNMDIGLPVPNVTADVTWVKNGKELVTSTQYLGYLGVHTGMRLGGWSVQANERVVLEPGPWGYEKSILASDVLALLERHQPVGYLLREALLAAPTFEDGLVELTKRKSVSPLYFIVGGARANEGAIITRNRGGLAHSPHNESVLLLKDAKSFYLAQTNWDPWIPIDKKQCEGTEEALPEYAQQACTKVLKMIFGNTGGCKELCRLVSDGRHEAAVAGMEKIQAQDITMDKIFDVLSDPHVMQGNTQFTAKMIPATSYYSTTVRTEHPGLSQERTDTLVKEARLLIDLMLKIAPFVESAHVVV